ncbi:uncharacterized protein [Rutidosis leptorrhynchoides]|uniref:uncharacterized protein n=1 Tax=Rutidosis leptorrhynchoides TaxID=125765 RepID=UPI003A99F6BC
MWPISTLDLELELRDDKDKSKMRTEDVEFCVMRAHSRYNAILGRISLQRFGAIPSTIHGLVKFPTKQGVAALESNPLEALCASVMVKVEEKSMGPHRQDASSSGITSVKLRNILMTNLDVYCWRDADITGISRDVTQHHLNANVNMKPVRQKKRPIAYDRSEWLRGEVNKLAKANILRRIPMALEDEEKTVFHTDHGIYCYTKMSFGLKNAGATYQRMIDTTFANQIGRTWKHTSMTWSSKVTVRNSC